ncbi:MAG: hypothetical protein HKN51_06060 [Saprospiraceae bacterium]|nr:hypothetical protein [Saprospiraceae bacterium]
MVDSELYKLIVIAVVLMIVLVLFVLLIFSVSKRRILDEISKSQQKEIEFSKALLKNSIETLESERTRIARDLHDGVTSKLNVVNLNFNLLKAYDSPNAETAKLIESIHGSINESIDLTREISHNLISPSFTKFGIETALESLAVQVNQGNALSIELQLNHDWHLFSKMDQLHIYRIIQELVNNSIKHAEASKIEVSSIQKENEVSFAYVDNGKGLENHEEFESGIGIKNIKARLRLLGAHAESLTDQPGFHYNFIIPKNV